MYFCFYLSYEISCFKICHLSVKLYTAAIFLVGNAFKSPHKIQVPEFSAELSIGDRMEACCFLLCNDFCHALIGDAVEFFLCDGSFLKSFLCSF